MSSPPISDVQRTKEDGAFVKSKVDGEQGQTYERSGIKSEGSNTDEREDQGVTKDNKIDELSSGSPQTEEEGSEGKSFERRYRVARGTMKSVSHFINPVGGLIDPINLDKNKWTAARNSIDGGNTKDTHGTDTRELDESNGWRGSGRSALRSGVTSGELRLDCRG